MKYDRKIRSLGIVLVLAVLATAGDCAFQRMRENLKNCKFDLDSVQVKEVSFSAIKLGIDVGIENPNPEQVILDQLVFDLYSNDKKLGSGKHNETAVVAPSERKVVNIDFETSLSNVGMGLIQTLQSGRATYRLDGTAYLQTFLGKVPVPFSIEKDLSSR
ncbi:MAG: LEA type 2 family protein [Leptospiraceae bacterium]|nr:LEA type 2 family protein [Leptospiraceae bacterium]